jgi:hypothetical protein
MSVASFEVGDEVAFIDVVPGVSWSPEPCPVPHYGLVTSVDDSPAAATTAEVLAFIGDAKAGSGVLVTVREHQDNHPRHTWVLDAARLELVARGPEGRLRAAAADVLKDCHADSGPELRLRLALDAVIEKGKVDGQ